MQDAVLVLVLAVCAVTDLRNRKIYNFVLIPVLLYALVYNLVTGGWFGLGQSLLGMFVGIGILIIPFALGGMGGGDVKLLGVVGALKGPQFLWLAALGMGIAGGIMAVMVLIYRRQLVNTLINILKGCWILLRSGFTIWHFKMLDNGEKIMLPFGLAIAVGSAGALWWVR